MYAKSRLQHRSEYLQSDISDLIHRSSTSLQSVYLTKIVSSIFECERTKNRKRQNFWR